MNYFNLSMYYSVLVRWHVAENTLPDCFSLLYPSRVTVKHFITLWRDVLSIESNCEKTNTLNFTAVC